MKIKHLLFPLISLIVWVALPSCNKQKEDTVDENLYGMWAFDEQNAFNFEFKTQKGGINVPGSLVDRNVDVMKTDTDVEEMMNEWIPVDELVKNAHMELREIHENELNFQLIPYSMQADSTFVPDNIAGVLLKGKCTGEEMLMNIGLESIDTTTTVGSVFKDYTETGSLRFGLTVKIHSKDELSLCLDTEHFRELIPTLYILLGSDDEEVTEAFARLSDYLEVFNFQFNFKRIPTSDK